jgi:hypothetical protein
MMRGLTLAIPDDVNDELREIAVREFRRPRDQASVLLIEAIRRVSAEQAGEPDTSPTEVRPEGPDDRPTGAYDESTAGGITHDQDPSRQRVHPTRERLRR